MQKTKHAFTLVELVFVIVIIGILASVAIPRLALTRDDAKTAVGLSEIGLLISQLSVYYTSQKEFSSNLIDMTDIPNVKYSTAWNNINEEGILTYSTESGLGVFEDCIDINIQNSEGNITVSKVLNVVTTTCKRLQSNSMFRATLGTKLVGGNRIKF